MNGGPAALMQARIGSASPNENKVRGSRPRLRHWTVTTESFPPPTGTQVFRGKGNSMGRIGEVLDCRIAKWPRNEIPFLKANSAKPFS